MEHNQAETGALKRLIYELLLLYAGVRSRSANSVDLSFYKSEAGLVRKFETLDNSNGSI